MKTIITAGKGGTGKSMTMAYLLKRFILLEDWGRVLAIDADPHESLSRILLAAYNGHAPVNTLGELRHSHLEDLRRGTALEISRGELAQVLVREAVKPLPGGDLLVMGRNDQAGCQCVVNSLLGRALDALQAQYDLILVDNEAGLEHLGRQSWPVDVLLLFVAPRPQELEVARQIVARAAEVGREIKHTVLVFNRVRDGNWRETVIPFGFDTALALPYAESLETQEQPDEAWLAELGKLWGAILRGM